MAFSQGTKELLAQELEIDVKPIPLSAFEAEEREREAVFDCEAFPVLWWVISDEKQKAESGRD